MARNRMIKPTFWDDEKIGSEPESVQLTYVGTWNFSDDYGVVKANPLWLKNKIYPYKHALRLDVFSKWLEALEGHEKLIPFTVRGEKYYFIRTFRLHQSVEKPSKSRNCTEEELVKAMNDLGYYEQSDGSWVMVGEQSGSTRVVVVDEEKRREEKLNNEANASVGAKAPPKQFDEDKELKKEFSAITLPESASDAWPVVKDWIIEKKPQFIEPYVAAWNIFASFYKLPGVQKINDTRRRKFAVRIKETGFDFIQILSKVRGSDFLKGSSWFGFDWLLENDQNYLKVLEGNYK